MQQRMEMSEGSSIIGNHIPKIILPLVPYIRNKRQHFLDPNYKNHITTLLLNFLFTPN